MTGSQTRNGAGRHTQAGSWRRTVLPTMAWLALVALVVAVPVGLLLFGDVPFAHVRLTGVARALTGRNPDGSRLISEWLSQGGLLLAWLTWAWLTVCVTLEIRAWSRGRSARRLPASRALQSLATCLVGTALAISAVGRGPSTSRSTGGYSLIQGRPSVPLIRVIDDTGAFSGPTLGENRGSLPPGSLSVGSSSWEGPEPADIPTASLRRARLSVGGLAGADEMESSPATGSHRGEVDAVRGVHHLAVAAPQATPTTDTTTTRWPVLPSVHLVKTRETLWSIATEKLGTALRWEEIAELNYGLRQADGGMLTSDHWIRPGWRLLLPRGPEVPPVDRVGGLGVDHLELEHLPGERPDRSHRSVRSDPQPERAHAQADRSDESLSERAGPERVSVPSPPIGLPLWPELPGLASVSGPTGVRPAATADPDGVRPLVPSVGRADAPVEHPRSRELPFTPVGAGVVGAGVVRMIERMRRAQQRHREDGHFIRLPDQPHTHLEQRLRLGEYGSTVDDVDRSLHSLTPSMLRSGREVPVVEGVRVRPEVIELIVGDFSDPAGPAPSDAVISDLENRTVSVDRETRPPLIPGPSSSTGRRGPAPLLVSAGRGPDGTVMVNLEFLGTLAVEGAPLETEGFVRALALELATSYWSGQFELVVVGFGSELERFDRVTSVTDGPTLVHRLCRRQLTGREALRTTGYASFAQARWIEDSDRWDPLVVICGPQVVDHLTAELLDCASDPRLGTAVIVAGTTSGARHRVSLTGDGRSLGLGRLGTVVFPQRVDSDEMQAVTTLLDTAASQQGVLASAEPYARLSMPLPAPSEPGSAGYHLPRPALVAVPLATRAGHDGSDGVPEGIVEVAVLGPVEIRGAARDFVRAWARELVVYLAMHPNGASNEAWATALWPDRLMAPSSLYSTASVARRSLGQTPDGQDHLPRSHGRLALAPSVSTDWARFVILARSDDPNDWRSALDLVRGRPFEGLRASDWPLLEGIAPAIESAVVDLSGRLAGACLRAGDARGAEWSARRGLLVSPYDERLYRMLMRAADLGGNPAGVEAVMSELVRLVADDVEPFDSVHPATMDLYRSLTRRNPVSGSGHGS